MISGSPSESGASARCTRFQGWFPKDSVVGRSDTGMIGRVKLQVKCVHTMSSCVLSAGSFAEGRERMINTRLAHNEQSRV